MISKIWKKVAFVILIVACLFNITYKLVKKMPVLKELSQSVSYAQNEEQQNTTETNTVRSNNIITTTKSNTKTNNSSNVTANSVIDLLK